jgi:hypothetical protein
MKQQQQRVLYYSQPLRLRAGLGLGSNAIALTLYFAPESSEARDNFPEKR